MFGSVKKSHTNYGMEAKDLQLNEQ